MSAGAGKYILNPSRSELDENWEFSNYRVFYDPCWVDSLMRETQVPICFMSKSKGKKEIISIAVHENGPIGGSLWFPTLPIIFQNGRVLIDSFWSTVVKYIRSHFVSTLKILSYDSSPIDIPLLFRNGNIGEREEFLWDISDIKCCDFNSISKNHRRNIKKGEKSKTDMLKFNHGLRN